MSTEPTPAPLPTIPTPAPVPVTLPTSGAYNFEIDKSGPIRRFVDSGLQDAVMKITNSIPADQHAVFMAIGDPVNGATAVLAVRGKGTLGEWSVALGGAVDMQANFSAQLAVRWSV